MKGLCNCLKGLFSRKKDKNDQSPTEVGAATGSLTMTVAGQNTFRVTIPDSVSPGEEFQVNVGSRIVRVRCPPDSGPGKLVRITVPEDPDDASAPSEQAANKRVNDPNTLGGVGENSASIPEDIQGGQTSPAATLGQQHVNPQNSRPGMTEGIIPPPPEEVEDRAPREEKTQTFEAKVPPGVEPGQSFALLANGVRLLVTCPANALPGQSIRFKVPLAITQTPEATNEAAKIKLSYNKDGWQRTIRVSDMKFQWVRVDDKGDFENETRFHMTKSAYVRKLEFVSGSKPHIRSGILSIVPANELFVDSRIRISANRDLVTYSDIANNQVKSFEEKAKWWEETCSQLRVNWHEGHMSINVRRQFILDDSVNAIMSLSRIDMRKSWRFHFIGEAGIDAGGLTREWFQLVSEKIFDPEMGLWQSSQVNQMCMEINPTSEICCEDHLVYYRFIGRVMGKALFDGELIACHMVQSLYKHLLGWPITFSDLEMVDEEYYSSLKKSAEMHKNGDDISMLCFDFTATQEIMGEKRVIDLISDGANTEVTNENFPEYMEANLKYRMVDQVEPQLCELLLGFYDVIPEPLLTVFDFQELELLMCGLPEIDLEDWKEHTEYTGTYHDVGADNPACKWFWEVVSDFDQEMKARLLQFATGTSGVPSRGFAFLQGSDGDVRRFTIYGVSLGECLYPRAHTCFNRIDLPMYESKSELYDKLKLAVTMFATGFDIE